MSDYNPFSAEHVITIGENQYKFKRGDSRCCECPLTGDKCPGNGYKCRGGRFHKVKPDKRAERGE